MSMQEKQHINVFVRIKPVSTTACDEKCIVEMISDKEIMVYERSQDKTSKMFTFDGVFGPSSTQVDVYDTVVSPLVKEVIAGYNCTVFAYGQTGTGKTYTMEGDRADNPNLHWQSDTSAGMIPRCLSHLFDELQLLENQQYTVRVNFLELYNEELIDLLMDGNDTPSKIKLYEDVTKKGSVIIHGLDEMTVHSKAEIYRILEKGSERRQTAATMLNSNSSRSHTVFSITIHTKENTSGGEELLKTAKLNLVDLAGSEHVGRSGAVEKRAREARSINQSLLTLGRVITALVEKAPHVPYRESKLTRLLQESLGGRTKTSIIATVSSASGNLEETLSTLDYAYRAKNITNRPEINQKICKRALLKEYTKEIERLKRDLVATRERNGVYVSFSDYDAMQTLIDCQRKEVKKKKNYCQVLEDVIQNKEKIFNDLRYQYDAQVGELTKNTSELNDINGYLRMTKESLRQVECVKNEQKRRVDKYVETERILHTQMKTILNVVNEASEDAQKLHDKLDRKTKVEEENKKLGLQMRSDFTKRCGNIEDVLVVQKKEIHALLQSVKDEVETHVTAQAINIEASIRSIVDSAVYQHYAASKESKKDINTFYTHYQKELDTHMQNASAIMETENKLLNDIFSKLVPDVRDLLESSYNGVMQNLQFLSRNIDQKLESVSMYAKHAVETVRRNRLEERNYLLKSLREISEDIKGISLNEKQRMENYKKFGKMQISNKTAIEKGNVLVTDLQERLSTSCATLHQHNNNVQFIGKQLQEKMAKDENKILISSANIFKTVEDTRLTHDKFMKKQQSKISEASRMMDDKFMNQRMGLNNIHNNIIEELGASQQQIDKFLTEDFCRDVCTGTTPERKIFSYPRELTTMSPSERIIQRFQEDKNYLDEAEVIINVLEN
ncbi:kinesin-like protein Klp61F isoform X3 [Temnothorax americanus]|uniref:kinesin-like protein Klp61F isoform X3 n=1 Tax=Temnothorax americanus TaxID=1964332 RepID=UPI004067F216